MNVKVNLQNDKIHSTMREISYVLMMVKRNTLKIQVFLFTILVVFTGAFGACSNDREQKNQTDSLSVMIPNSDSPPDVRNEEIEVAARWYVSDIQYQMQDKIFHDPFGFATSANGNKYPSYKKTQIESHTGLVFSETDNQLFGCCIVYTNKDDHISAGKEDGGYFGFVHF